MTTIFLICGASGSGKSTVCDKIIDEIGKENICVVKEDWYYIPLKEGEDATTHNFDIPSSLDWDNFVSDVEKLKNSDDGTEVEAPVYDFVTHSRTGTQKVTSKKLIIIEGILLFTCEKLRDLSEYLVYVKANQYICFLRRMKRDVKERGRTIESVEKQYNEQVYPAYEQYVKPLSVHADVTVHNNKNDDYTGMKIIIEYVKLKFKVN